MHLLYSLAFTVAFFALSPYFIYQALRRGKYSEGFKERLGFLPESLRGGGRQTIWIHAVSVGEFLAAKPLTEAIKRDMPGCRIVVSTTTLTGQRLARAQASSLFDAVFYFPFDWAFSSRRSINHIAPALVVILETELWPNFLRECRRRGVPVAVVNGRISPRSFARYSRVRSFMRRALDNLALLAMQSEADADRARSLGADAGRVRVCGNLKYDAFDLSGATDSSAGAAGEIDRLFGLTSSRHLIVAGSTAPGEEKILLMSLGQVRERQGLGDARLLIAPRHPERFNEVAGLIAQSGFKFARRSEAADAGAADVVLLDSIGELAALYRFAAVVFVGGSLVERGGHNILEPAAYGKPIIVGPHTENFRQMVADFAEEGAVVRLSGAGDDPSSELAREMIRLLSDPASACEMGTRARGILLKNRGATGCVVAAIKDALNAGAQSLGQRARLK